MNRRQTLAGLSALGVSISTSHAGAAGKRPKVITTLGPVEGQVKSGVSVFLGLRYGQDTGPARFQPPRRPEVWRDVAKADRYGPACPQQSTPDAYGKSEDCLFLNVWTPEAQARVKRPVMIYLHGGAYNNGSGSDPLYDGTNLALRGDVVVVTINHRLNAFGYLYLSRIERLLTGQEWPLRYSGNTGQMDILLALEWIRDNIAAFGGDPANIMLFGQSGGGAKIATLMATPSAAGLFHKAATMSGQQVTASGPGNATLRATAYLEALGLKADGDGLAKVQVLPMEALMEALKAPDPVIGSGSMYFGPVVDETHLMRHPFYPDAAPQSLHIPMMIGNTRDETRAFLGGNAANHSLTWDDLPTKLPPQYRVDIDPWLVIDTYRRLYPDMTPSQVFFAATTAGRSWRGAIIEAEERAKAGAPAYVFQTDWQSPKDGGKWGAPHGIEIPLIFRTTHEASSVTTDSAEARQMADLFSDAFVAFARTGSPQTQALPQWVPYGMEKRETMLMDLPPALAPDPRGEERKLFEKVPFIQQGT